jgi:hypothetical protein
LGKAHEEQEQELGEIIVVHHMTDLLVLLLFSAFRVLDMRVGDGMAWQSWMPCTV